MGYKGCINGYYLQNINGKEFVYDEYEFEHLMLLADKYNIKTSYSILTRSVSNIGTKDEEFGYFNANKEQASELALALRKALTDILDYNTLLNELGVEFDINSIAQSIDIDRRIWQVDYIRDLLIWYSEDFRMEKLEKFIAFCNEGSFSIKAMRNDGITLTFEFIDVNGKQFVLSEYVFPKIIELAEAYGWKPWNEMDDLHLRVIKNVEAKEMAFALRCALKDIPKINLYPNLGSEYEHYMGRHSNPFKGLYFESLSKSKGYNISPVDFYQISFSRPKDYKLDQIKSLFLANGTSVKEYTCQLLIWFSNDLLKDKLMKFIAFCEEESFVIYNEQCIKYEEVEDF